MSQTPACDAFVGSKTPWRERDLQCGPVGKTVGATGLGKEAGVDWHPWVADGAAALLSSQTPALQ